MLGVVPVQTIGPVYPGDGLFASEDIAGVATPEDYVANKRNETLIGFALESYDCPDDEVYLNISFILYYPALRHMHV